MSLIRVELVTSSHEGDIYRVSSRPSLSQSTVRTALGQGGAGTVLWVWSPVTGWQLFGTTTDVDGAIRALMGVPTAHVEWDDGDPKVKVWP